MVLGNGSSMASAGARGDIEVMTSCATLPIHPSEISSAISDLSNILRGLSSPIQGTGVPLYEFFRFNRPHGRSPRLGGSTALARW